jgi:hypothetical protein
MKYNKGDWKYMLGLCFIPVLLGYGIWRSYQITHFSRYVIGTTTRRIFSAKNGFEIEFIYYVNDNKYKSYRYDMEQYHIRYPNGRYYVKYSYKNPSACEIQWGLPVPDTIRLSPKNGWKDLP